MATVDDYWQRILLIYKLQIMCAEKTGSQDSGGPREACKGMVETLTSKY